MLNKIVIFLGFIILFGCNIDKNQDIIINNNIQKKPQIKINTGYIKQENNQINQILTGTYIKKPIIDVIVMDKNVNFRDDDIKKFVNDKEHFNNLKYTPLDLEYFSSEYIKDIKGNQYLRTLAKNALNNMAIDFYNEFKTKLVVVSAYRSYIYQKGIKDRGCSDLFCAKAGYSEHQTGLAVDLFEASSEKEFLSKNNYVIYFNWLNLNAHKYGFHNSYQKGKKIDGYVVEPWHWRYLGVELATLLYEKKITYAEYINMN